MRTGREAYASCCGYIPARRQRNTEVAWFGVFDKVLDSHRSIAASPTFAPWGAILAVLLLLLEERAMPVQEG